MASQLDIRSLPLDKAAELLGLSVERVREHVARGLPLRRDGRVDLVVYAAWLNTEEARAADARA